LTRYDIMTRFSNVTSLSGKKMLILIDMRSELDFLHLMKDFKFEPSEQFMTNFIQNFKASLNQENLSIDQLIYLLQ
jgi:hypothetical protein